MLEALEGKDLTPDVEKAAQLLATVVGQDVDHDIDGVFRIARRTAKDRVISVVDPDARHGRKTSSQGFDGYKGHIAIDPDSEIITAAAAGAANGSDADEVKGLLAEPARQAPSGEVASDDDEGDHAEDDGPVDADADASDTDALVVYGDSAYGSGPGLGYLASVGAIAMTKVQTPTAPGGRFPKDRFAIDLDARTVACPGDVTVPLLPLNDGGGIARFGDACASCPLRDQCTASPAGRTVSVGPYESLLVEARTRQQDPAWQDDYNAHRPKVERKLAHLLRRIHGGRRARVRGRPRVDQDWKLRAAAVNLARLAVLQVSNQGGAWALA